MNKHKCVIFTLAYTSFMTDSHNCSGRKNTAAAAAEKKKSVQQLHSCQHHFVSVENIYKNCTRVKYMKWWSIKSINSLNSLKIKTNNNNKKQLYPHVHTVIVKFVFKPVTFWWGDTLAGTTSSHMVNWKLPIRGVGSFTAALLGFHLH